MIKSKVLVKAGTFDFLISILYKIQISNKYNLNISHEIRHFGGKIES